MWTNVYLVVVTIVAIIAVIIAIILFRILRKDNGSRVYSVPAGDRQIAESFFVHSGLPMVGRFSNDHIKHTVFRDRTTALVVGDADLHVPAITFPASDPVAKAEQMIEWLRSRGINVSDAKAPIKGLENELVTFSTPWGFDAGYRLPLSKMPKPSWE